MNNKQNELLINAEFNEIICRLIYEFGIVSEVKIVFVSLGIYNMNLGYEGTSKKYDLFKELISEITISLNMNPDKMVIIFDCLNLLTRTNFIKIKDGLVIKEKNPKNISHTIGVMNSEMFNKLVYDIEKVSDQTLIKEVIRNV